MHNYFRLIIIAIFFLLSFSFFLGYASCMFDDTYLLPDAHDYIDAANMLYDHACPHPTRPMGIALLLGLPKLFFEKVSNNQYIIFSICLNTVAWLATILLLYKTVSLFSSSKISYYLSLVYLFSIGSVSNLFLVMTETLSTFFLMLMSYFMLKFLQNQSIKYLFVAVSSLNFAILMRPGIMYFAIIANIILIIYLVRKKIYTAWINIPFIVSWLLIIVQCISMYRVYGNFTLSYIDKATWYYYLGAKASAKANNRSCIAEQAIRLQYFDSLSWQEQSNIAYQDAKYQLSHNLKNVVIEYSYNVIDNTLEGSSSFYVLKQFHHDTFHQQCYDVLFYISALQNKLYVFAVFCACLLLLFYSKKIDFFLIISLGITFYLIITSGISFWQGDRFHIVFYPISILACSYLFFLIQKNILVKNTSNKQKNDNKIH